MNKTTWTSSKDVKRVWYEIDATGVSLGRLAVKVAKLLMGKTTVEYVPNLDMGNYVIITNAKSVKLTGTKQAYLDIRHYTGFPSGLRKEKVSNLMEKNPAKVIETAIRGMLPDTKMKDQYMARLNIYVTGDHKHEAQKPVKISV